jgi:hypothetical protein
VGRSQGEKNFEPTFIHPDVDAAITNFIVCCKTMWESTAKDQTRVMAQNIDVQDEDKNIKEGYFGFDI